MRKPSSRQWILGAVVLGVGTLVARELSAEIPTVHGIGKVTTVTSAVALVQPGTDPTLVTATVGKEFVLTDIIISNPGSNPGTMSILDVNATASPPTSVTLAQSIEISPQSSFDHQFGSGIQIGPQHQLRVLAGNAPQSAMPVTVTGYFRKS